MKKQALVITLLSLLLSVAGFTSHGQATGGCSVQFTYQVPAGSMNVYFVPSQSNVPATYSWDFGDGSQTVSAVNPQHLYLHSGTYLVCVNATFMNSAGIACTAHWCDSVHVGTIVPNCNAQFTWTSASNTLTGIAFTPAVNATGTTYSWNFGDGATSTQPNPTHVYATPGPYFVCLTVNGNGCSANWCDSVFVVTNQVNCDAHFSTTSVSATGGLYFNPVMNAVGASYSWDFGDGSSDTIRTPVHHYATPGTYLACLTVTRYTTLGGVACTAHFCDSVHASTPVVNCDAHFTYMILNTTGASGYYFNPAANPAGATYSWNFGDGGTSSMRTPTHVYASAGVYFACLTVTVPGVNGGITCTASWCDSVHVNAPVSGCWAMFTYNVSANLATAYFHPATTAFGTVYTWDFGDGTTATQMAPSHQYAQPGAYWVCLTTTRTSSNGSICTDTHCDSVHIAPLPPPVCNSHFQFMRLMTGPRTFRFYALNQSPGANYAWSFGDGDTSTLGSPIHTYADTGAYQVCLIVTNTNSAGSCSDTTCRMLLVYPLPFHSNTGCYANFGFHLMASSPSTVAFFMNSPGSLVTGLRWDFGDSTSSTQANPVHQYPGPGVYTVCLNVFDSIGHCQSRTCRQLIVGPVNISVEPGDDENAKAFGSTKPIASAMVFPNPAHDRAQLVLTGSTGNAIVFIFDATGRCVFTKNALADGTLDLPIEGLSSGIYYYRILDMSTPVASGKLIIR